MMDPQKAPGIKIDAIILAELSFHRDPMLPQILEFEFVITAETSINEDKSRLQLSLTVDTKEKNSGSITARCRTIGLFSVDNEHKNMPLEEFAKANAPALMLPFCREVLASTSIKSGIPAILMPPMNMTILSSPQPAEGSGK